MVKVYNKISAPSLYISHSTFLVQTHSLTLISSIFHAVTEKLHLPCVGFVIRLNSTGVTLVLLLITLVLAAAAEV